MNESAVITSLIAQWSTLPQEEARIILSRLEDNIVMFALEPELNDFNIALRDQLAAHLDSCK